MDPIVPDLSDLPPKIAWIDEPLCIGCTKCILACPYDAILGAAGQMHTVLTDLCTGCELCVEPCPVDCIEMRPTTISRGADWVTAARARFQARIDHLEREKQQREAKRIANRSDKDQRMEMKAEIAAAVERTRNKRKRMHNSNDIPNGSNQHE